MKNDGLIRLTHEALRALDLRHLISGLDEDAPPQASEGAVLTHITGYTEWVTLDPPCVTLGWDWIMHSTADAALQRVGEPRSNLMLKTGAGYDLGHAASSTLLENFIDDGMWWQAEALAYLRVGCQPR